jgi:hypothetical protein
MMSRHHPSFAAELLRNTAAAACVPTMITLAAAIVQVMR